MINYDSSIHALPELLKTTAGDIITSVEEWQQKRRPEILELFSENVFGKPSAQRPVQMNFELVGCTEGVMGGTAVRKKVDIHMKGPGGSAVIHLILFIPIHTTGPVPTFLLICNRDNDNIDPERDTKSSFWPAETIVARGYAAAAFQVADLDPDEHDEFKNGVHGVFDTYADPRPANAWGTISAWAWGASRVMDYFETDKDIDIRRVALIGHSRGGKTALWCGAQDERFAMVISNDSGCTGAAITRGKQGETIKEINDRFPHWFCSRYKDYNDKEYELPLDQHMLLALIAPRLLYVASASEDIWADPQAEFFSCVQAEPAYELFGLRGLGTGIMPTVEAPIHSGKIGHHIHKGGHDLTDYDWKCYMDFADRHMNA